jgi:hypothetical protein
MDSKTPLTTSELKQTNAWKIADELTKAHNAADGFMDKVNIAQKYLDADRVAFMEEYAQEVCGFCRLMAKKPPRR